MATTIVVAMPATANAPPGPRLTISSTSASLPAAGRSSLDVMAGARSFRQEFAKLVGLRRRDGCAGIAPRYADVRDDRGHLLVVEDMGERWHAVRARIFSSAWWKA